MTARNIEATITHLPSVQRSTSWMLAAEKPTTAQSARRLALCWRDDPGSPLPEDSASLKRLLRGAEQALAEAENGLLPGSAGTVAEFIRIFAERRGLAMPAGAGLELDIEIMSSWPTDLFRKAARGVWEDFTFRRMPEVPDFKRYIAEDLRSRTQEIRTLREFCRSLAARMTTASAAASPTPRRRKTPTEVAEVERILSAMRTGFIAEAATVVTVGSRLEDASGPSMRRPGAVPGAAGGYALQAVPEAGQRTTTRRDE
jgi:hypothetical protein